MSKNGGKIALDPAHQKRQAQLYFKKVYEQDEGDVPKDSFVPGEPEMVSKIEAVEALKLGADMLLAQTMLKTTMASAMLASVLVFLPTACLFIEKGFGPGSLGVAIIPSLMIMFQTDVVGSANKFQDSFQVEENDKGMSFHSDIGDLEPMKTVKTACSILGQYILRRPKD